MRKAVVVGGGLGGLSAAIRLASGGFAVTLLESQAALGGKLQRRGSNGYLFDRGASTMTMPWVFEQVIRDTGREPEQYLNFYRLESAARNVFADGSIVDFTGDTDFLRAQIAAYSAEDAARLPAFLAEARKMYNIAQEQFMNKLLIGWKSKANPALMMSMLRIRPFTSVLSLLRRYFSHPNTLALFGRYATYVGSAPAKTPSVFTLMAHLEQSLGVYGVKGGTYSIVSAFANLACELGVRIRLQCPVREIVVRGGRAIGVETDSGLMEADVIVANADALTVYRKLIRPEARPLLSDRKIAAYEPSLSGFVLLLGVRRKFHGLRHHNVWFPQQYDHEFRDIFTDGIPPVDPAVYVCWSGCSESGMAPEGGSNLFVLVNAPSLSSRWDWEANKQSYRDLIIAKLQQYIGLDPSDIEVEEMYSPDLLERDTGAHQGAIYGISSNRLSQAFFRPSNQAPGIDGLWFAGGSTHPGGGTPIVTSCGRMVAERILAQYKERM